MSYNGQSLYAWRRRLFDLKPYAPYILIYGGIYMLICVIHGQRLKNGEPAM